MVSLTPYQIMAMSNNLKADPLVKQLLFIFNKISTAKLIKQLLFIFKKITTAKLITKKNLTIVCPKFRL